LMMSLKQKFTLLFEMQAKNRPRVVRRWSTWGMAEEWQKKVVLVNTNKKPWKIAAKDKEASIVYVDGSWSYLHEAQDHFLREAAKQADYLVVGVHRDEVQQKATGSYPPECFDARLARLRAHPKVTCILEDAPWVVSEDLILQLGINKVLAGSPISKLQDCVSPATGSCPAAEQVDPYAECRRLNMFHEVPSLNTVTENDVWMKTVARVIFSNVDASIDWRILVQDGKTTKWGENPGYAPNEKESRTSSFS